MVKGVAFGTYRLFADPIAGANQSGFPGFCQGLASGLAAAVSLPVAGAAVGCVQVGRGLINSAEAVIESSAGKDWDPETRSWYAYSLVEDAEKVRHLDEFASSSREGSSQEGARHASRRPPKESTYYERLGVAHTASTDEIKKAYYKRALRLHPDKNANDEAAKEQFQQISEAYQVLADDKLREKYDTHGQASLEQVNLMDAGVFFTMLFGSDRFEPYTGTLALAAAASMEGQISIRRMQVRQTKREVQCALAMAERVATFVRGDKEQFVSTMATEAADLASVSFGDCLLLVVAEVYKGTAAEYLGYKRSLLGVDGHVAALKSKKLSFDNHTAAAGAGFRAVGAAVRTYKLVRELKQRDDGGATETDPLSGLSANALQATQESLPLFLEAMWHVSVVDVERTLEAAMYKLFHDHSVGEAERLLRAEAVALIGDVFMRAAIDKGGTKDPRAKVAELVRLMGRPPATAGRHSANDAQPGARQAGQAGQQQHAGEKGAQEPMPTHSVQELRALPVRELKRLALVCGCGAAKIASAVEKEDLVQMLSEAMHGPAGESDGAGGGGGGGGGGGSCSNGGGRASSGCSGVKS